MYFRLSQQEVKDIESWIYNLTAANQNDMQNPIWYRQFSLRDAFNLKDLSPSSMSSLVQDLSKNSSAAEQVSWPRNFVSEIFRKVFLPSALADENKRQRSAAEDWLSESLRS